MPGPEQVKDLHIPVDPNTLAALAQAIPYQPPLTPSPSHLLGLRLPLTAAPALN